MAKHKSGYDILKEKYDALNELLENATVNFAQLENKCQFMEHQMEEAKNTMNELYAHMGAFRRWTWNRKHKS